MVTPEEIARAMAVHSIDDEPRGKRDDDESRRGVMVDDKQVDTHGREGDGEPHRDGSTG